MAQNYISISQNVGRFAQSLLSVTNSLASQRDLLILLKRDMDQMVNGTDYTMLESNFGLPTGKGQTVYNLVAGAVAELASASNFNLMFDYLGATR